MFFHNITDGNIHICINGRKEILEPGKTIRIDCSSPVKVFLSHSYDSKALSKKEIMCDDIDVSLISLAIASYKKPYFDIVLDCVYEISFIQDTQVYIRKDTIRPVYPCSYDRLYPVVECGTVKELVHTFSQKEQFKKHYLDAVSSGNRKILVILLCVLAFFSVPLLALFLLVNHLIGIFAVIGTALFFLLVYFLGTSICKLMCKADCAIVFSNFESDKIISFFKKD